MSAPSTVASAGRNHDVHQIDSVAWRPSLGSRPAIAGLFRTRCGLQRGAELMVADFRAQANLVSAIDLSRPLGQPTTLTRAGLIEPEDLTYGGVSDLVVHLNPPDFQRAIDLFPKRSIAKARIVGYWAWELSVIPEEWRLAAERCDAIWVPSPFVASALMAGLSGFGGDIRVVPHAVDRDPIATFDAAKRIAVRARHRLDPADFVVGFTFAFGSNYARKNPVGAIDAFRRAFGETDAGCRLVLRCHEVAEYARLFRHLRGYVGDDERIVLIDAAATPFPIVEFYNCLDVFLSLHRSEGYGLAIAEAAQVGVRAITTGWGLAPDIMRRPEVWTVDSRLVVPLDPQNTYDDLDGALWAEPDVAQAARLLVLARAERERRH